MDLVIELHASQNSKMCFSHVKKEVHRLREISQIKKIDFESKIFAKGIIESNCKSILKVFGLYLIQGLVFVGPAKQFLETIPLSTSIRYSRTSM